MSNAIDRHSRQQELKREKRVELRRYLAILWVSLRIAFVVVLAFGGIGLGFDLMGNNTGLKARVGLGLTGLSLFGGLHFVIKGIRDLKYLNS